MSQSYERATVDEYNDLLAEVERLRAIIGDQQILLDEHSLDNRHAFDEGGNNERAAVVAWLRRGDECCVANADRIEGGEHRRKEGEK